MTAQLTLSYNDAYLLAEQWRLIRSCIADIVTRVGHKQCAYDLDLPPSTLSKALAEEDRHPMHAQWLLYFLRHDTDGKLAALLVDLGGFEIVRKRELSPLEKLDRIEAELAKYPPEFSMAFKRSAGVP